MLVDEPSNTITMHPEKININSGLLALCLLFGMVGQLWAVPAERVFSHPQHASKKPQLTAAERARLIRKNVPAFADDRVLVKFRPGTAAAETGRVHRAAGGHVLDEIPAIGVHVVKVTGGSVTERVARYARNPNVEYAEPDYYRVLVIPDEGNDPGPEAGGIIAGREYFEEQWG
jgi:hypothetical protein